MNSFRNQIGKPPPKVEEDPLLPEKGKREAIYDDLTSISIRRSQVRGGSTRTDDRHRLTAEEVIIYDHNGFDHTVTLINLSMGGAMIHCDLSLELWEPVSLEFGDGGVIEACVRWIKGKKVGLEFTAETQFGCGQSERDAIVMETIRNSFPNEGQWQAEPQSAFEQMVSAREALEQDRERRRSNQRAIRRHPLIWTGEIHYNHDSHPVRLRNISETGALIEIEKELPYGDELLLDLNEAGTVFATVSWSRGGQSGLAFKTPYNLSQLASAKPKIATSGWQTPDYLRKAVPPASRWASHWETASLRHIAEDLEGFLKR